MNRIDRTYFQDVLNAEVLSCDLLTQGQIGPLFTLQTPARKYLLKTSAPSERLPTEARMLGDINKYKIAVPRVYDVSDTHLLMAYIPTETVPKELQEHRAADLLASLHSIGNDERMYGYWYDTTIGPFEQKNEQTQYNWALFFGQMRIMPMARICYDKGVISKGMLDRLEVLCHTLYRRIDMSKITPSLLHGDLWSGNILFNMNEAVLIDPALYFGDREMELAFILMFNTFGRDFFDTYTRTYPLSEDFYDVKVPLYQIYPFLVHVALYGHAYVGGLEERLERLKV
jgi:fructosamine-3-kinase